MNQKKITQLLVLSACLCTQLLFAQSSTIDCESITMQSTGSQLTITGLAAPNAIIKVFDDDWQLFFECDSDCGDVLTFSDLPAGDTYHLDAQLYDENWQLVCGERLDQQIGVSGGEICPDAVCNGNVYLKSQAEVDAFRGCEAIGGELIIGFFFTDDKSDITSIANLSQLKRVQGRLAIANNPNLTDLRGLEQVENVGSVALKNNTDLRNVDALENLTQIEFNLEIQNCPSLSNINGVRNLNFVQRINFFNTAIESLQPLANLENTYLSGLSIRECNSLTSLDGLENLGQIDGQSFNPFYITSNALLENVSALRNLRFVNGNLGIFDNPMLNDCCGIAQLIGADQSNGSVIGSINVTRNLMGCNSPTEIQDNCTTKGDAACDVLEISSADNQLVIKNVTAPIANIKVYDDNFQLVFECNGNCETDITIPNLNRCEVYSYDIQLFTENYEHICSRVGDVPIKGSLTEPAVCKGDIWLRTQAEVDAFCGCDKIEGNLNIGSVTQNPLSNITDISNLSNLKEVTGFVNIRNSQIRTQLKG
ncbi:MAG: hypothetical protein AAF960_06990 [Bacteroidota bacterium]